MVEELLPEADTRLTSPQFTGEPPLSLARHSSIRLRPEPPESETEQDMVKEFPMLAELGVTLSELTVGLVVSAEVGLGVDATFLNQSSADQP
ncbi:hypothetical protein ACFLTN_04735 [Chloroflexota bacterium]